MSVRNRFCPCSRDSSGGRTKMGTHQAEEQKFYVALDSLLGVPMAYFVFTRNARLAWCLCTMSICKFCSPSLLCLIWFSRWWPGCFCVLPPDESLEQGRNRSQMLTCANPVMLCSLTCLLTDVVFSFLNAKEKEGKMHAVKWFKRISTAQIREFGKSRLICYVRIVTKPVLKNNNQPKYMFIAFLTICFSFS